MKYDKLLHFFVGFFIYVSLMAVTGSHGVSFLLVLLAAIGKEVYDVREKSKADFYDFYATGLGGIVGILVWSIV